MPSGKEDLPRVEQEMGRTFDAVIDAVGNETIINAGLPLVKMGGSICVYGVIAAPSLPVNKALVRTISISWSTNGRRAGANARPKRRSAGGFAKGSSGGGIRDPRVSHRANQDALAAVRREVVKCLLRYGPDSCIPIDAGQHALQDRGVKSAIFRRNSSSLMLLKSNMPK